MDWIPIVYQFKSLVQVIAFDVKGARQTHENFLRQCPIVSQVTSAVQVLSGDQEAARETQMAFLGTLSGVADFVPVFRHAIFTSPFFHKKKSRL
jgi:hypothetical protein